MRKITLETPNEFDLSIAELQALADDLRQLDDQLDVAVAKQEQRGAGVTFWDVLHFWLPDPDFVKEAAYGYLIARCQLALTAAAPPGQTPGQPAALHRGARP